MRNAAKAFTIKKLGSKGRGVMATQNIPKGTLLFEERPLVSCVYDGHLGSVCSYCLTLIPKGEGLLPEIPELMRGDIKTDVFCDNCIDVGEEHTGAIYGGLRNIHYTTNEGKLAAMARIIMARTLSDSLSRKSNLFEGAMKFMTFAENLPQVKDLYDDWIEYVVTHKNIDRSTVLKIVPYEMWERAMGILHLNCFTMSNNDSDVAYILFGLASFFNHSCVPNASCDGFEKESGFAKVKTVSDIEEGEEIFLTYVGLDQSFEERQRYLFLEYAFECKCQRCESEKPIGFELNVGGVCPKSVG